MGLFFCKHIVRGVNVFIRKRMLAVSGWSKAGPWMKQGYWGRKSRNSLSVSFNLLYQAPLKSHCFVKILSRNNLEKKNSSRATKIISSQTQREHPFESRPKTPSLFGIKSTQINSLSLILMHREPNPNTFTLRGKTSMVPFKTTDRSL